MSIPRSTAWALLSQRAGPTVVLAKMSYGNEDKYVPIGSRLVNLEDEDFLPLIANMPHRFQEVDFWTREFSISDLSLEILNMPFNGSTRFSDLFDERGAGNDRGFENRQADVRLWKPGITTWDDCFELFPAGVMRKPTTQGSSAIIEIQDHTFLTLQNMQLDRVTDADAADIGQGLPEESVGKIKPVIRGNHTFLKGNDSKAFDTASSINNLTPCVYLGIDSAGKHRWFVANHIINQINAEGDDSEQQEIWGFDSNINRFVRLQTTFTVEQNTSLGCIISHENDPSFYDLWYPKIILDSTGSSAENGLTFFANTDNVIDKNFSTLSTGRFIGVVLQNEWIGIDIGFLEYDYQGIDSANITQLDVMLYAKTILSGGALDGDYKIESIDQWDATTFPDPSGASYPDLRLAAIMPTAAGLGGIAATVQIRMTATLPLGPGETVVCELYQVYKRITYTPQKLLPLYFAGKGDEVGTDIGTNRAVVNGYDEQHADQGNSANLAENPATLIELSLRNDAGLGDSRLNLNSFNTASNDVAGLVGAPVFLEQPDSYLQALFTLIQQYRGFIWWTPSGELFLKILEDDYTTPDIIIDGDLITNLKYGRTDIRRLYTAVQMLYNEIDGANLLETPLVEDTTAQTWYNVTQGQTLLKQPAHGFNHNGAASAVSIGDYFLANQKNIHNTVEVQLPIMFNHLDIGDLIGFENLPENLRGEDLSASYTIAGQTIRPLFLVNSVDRSDEITLEGFQVHKLD